MIRTYNSYISSNHKINRDKILNLFRWVFKWISRAIDLYTGTVTRILRFLYIPGLIVAGGFVFYGLWQVYVRRDVLDYDRMTAGVSTVLAAAQMLGFVTVILEVGRRISKPTLPVDVGVIATLTTPDPVQLSDKLPSTVHINRLQRQFYLIIKNDGAQRLRNVRIYVDKVDENVTNCHIGLNGQHDFIKSHNNAMQITPGSLSRRAPLLIPFWVERVAHDEKGGGVFIWHVEVEADNTTDVREFPIKITVDPIIRQPLDSTLR